MTQDDQAKITGNSVLRLLSLRQRLAVAEYEISKRAQEIKGVADRLLGTVVNGVKTEFGESDYQTLRDGHILSSAVKVAYALKAEIDTEVSFLRSMGLQIK